MCCPLLPKYFVPKGKVKKVAVVLKAIHTLEDLEAAQNKAGEVTDKLESFRLSKASAPPKAGIHKTFSSFHFPQKKQPPVTL